MRPIEEQLAEMQQAKDAASVPDDAKAELQAAIEAAQQAEAHVLELMVEKVQEPQHTPPPSDIGPYPEPSLPHFLGTATPPAPNGPGTATTPPEPIRVHKLVDREAVYIVQGERRLYVPLKPLRQRFQKFGLAELQQLAPEILANPSAFGIDTPANA